MKPQFLHPVSVNMNVRVLSFPPCAWSLFFHQVFSFGIDPVSLCLQTYPAMWVRLLPSWNVRGETILARFVRPRMIANIETVLFFLSKCLLSANIALANASVVALSRWRRVIWRQLNNRQYEIIGLHYENENAKMLLNFLDFITILLCLDHGKMTTT